MNMYKLDAKDEDFNHILKSYGIKGFDEVTNLPDFCSFLFNKYDQETIISIIFVMVDYFDPVEIHSNIITKLPKETQREISKFIKEEVKSSDMDLENLDIEIIQLHKRALSLTIKLLNSYKSDFDFLNDNLDEELYSACKKGIKDGTFNTHDRDQLFEADTLEESKNWHLRYIEKNEKDVKKHTNGVLYGIQNLTSIEKVDKLLAEETEQEFIDALLDIRHKLKNN